MASSVSGPPVKRSPSSPTSGSTRCSTAVRSRPASRPATAAASWSTRTWAWSPRSSTSPRWAPCAGTWRSGTAATPRPAARPGRTPSRPSAPRPAARLRLGHNGNLTNTVEPARPGPGAVRRAGAARARHATRPTRRWSPRCWPATRTAASRPPRSRCWPSCAAPSAWSSWTSTRSTPRATRTASARWCSAGSSAAGSWPARPRPSTSSARACVREVEPGELDRDRRRRPAQHAGSRRPTPKGCVFEYVYLARPDTTIAGRVVHEARVEMGRQLARRAPGRRRPGHPDARVRHAGRDRLRRRSPASRTARAWSRTPTSGAPSSSPARRSASSASGSSSTRCAR